jgi:AcrR family transcriptional regulator
MKQDTETPNERNATKGQKTRADILDNAARLFIERGSGGTNMQAIAEAAGITRPALYYHFKNKDEVLRAVITESAELVARELLIAQDSGGIPMERLKRSVIVLTSWILAHPVRFLVSDQNRHNLPAAIAERHLAGKRKVMEIFELILREGVARGDFRPVNPQVAALSIIAMCTSTARWFSASGALSQDEVAAAIADLAQASVARPDHPDGRGGIRAAFASLKQELAYLEAHLSPDN